MAARTWSEAFDRYLQKQGLNQLDAFVALQKAHVPVTPSAVSYWCRGSRPVEETRKRIERWSDGAVPAGLPATKEEARSPRKSE